MARAGRAKGLRGRDPHARAGCAVVTARLKGARPYERRARDPDDVTGLHEMRIAVKRLRYAMELCVPCFGKRFRRYLDEVSGLQELLGNIHDSDVLIGYLHTKLSEASPRQAPAVIGLLARAQARRAATHGELCRGLDRLRATDFWASVPRAMRCGR